MSCERNAHGHLRGFAIADLPKQNLLRILSERRTQSRNKGQPCLRMHLKLTDALNAPLYRVLKRHDMTAWIIQRRERRIERCRLARVHRAAEEQQPRRPTNQLLEDLLIARCKTEFRTAEKTLRRVHDSHDHTLPVHYRQHGRTHIDRAPAVHIADLSILRTIALCRIDARHYFQPRNDHRRKLRRELHGILLQQPVHTHADAQPTAHGLEVNIGRLFFQRRIQNNIDQCKDVTAADTVLRCTAPHLACSFRHQTLQCFLLHAVLPLIHRFLRRRIIVHVKEIEESVPMQIA